MLRRLELTSLSEMSEQLSKGFVWVTWAAFLRYFKGLSVCKVQIRGLNDPSGVCRCLVGGM